MKPPFLCLTRVSPRRRAASPPPHCALRAASSRQPLNLSRPQSSCRTQRHTVIWRRRIAAAVIRPPSSPPPPSNHHQHRQQRRWCAVACILACIAVETKVLSLLLGQQQQRQQRQQQRLCGVAQLSAGAPRPGQNSYQSTMAALEELLHVADYLGFQVPPPALAAAATAGAGAGAAGKLQDRRHRHQQQPPRVDGEDTVVGCSGRRADDDDDYDNDDPLALAERLVADARAAHGAQLRLRLLLDALQAPGVADGGRLTARAAALKQASAALAAVQRHHTALGDRLRSARTRPSVPVAPAAQPAFSALLAAAAGGGPELRAGAAALEWAVRLREAPSVWEDSLRVLLDAGREAAHELEGLRALSAALDADVGDAGVRGGGGGGGGGAAGGGGVW